jgi:hypothetical protein
MIGIVLNARATAATIMWTPDMCVLVEGATDVEVIE